MKNLKAHLLFSLFSWYLLVGICLYIIGFYLDLLPRDTKAFYLMYGCYYFCMIVPSYILYIFFKILTRKLILFFAKLRLVKPVSIRICINLLSILICIIAYSHFLYLFFTIY